MKIVRTVAKTEMRGVVYIAPEVEMIEVATEKGFATSPTPNPGGGLEDI